MIKKLLKLVQAASLILGFAFVLACGASSSDALSFELTNPSTLPRKGALIVIKRTELETKLRDKKLAAFYAATANEQSLPVQLDDLDQDGQWDELVTMLDMEAQQAVTLYLHAASADTSKNYTSLAHVRHKRKGTDQLFGASLLTDSVPGTQPATDFGKQKLPPFLTEGPAWENDQLGFRLYFDTRNGKDIWGKLKPEMILDEVGKDTTVSYHELQPWGMDLLKVGPSLGAGGLALRIAREGKPDSLARLGGSSIGTIVYEQVADGPLRAVFNLRYKNWKLDPAQPPVDVVETISIWGKQLFYESNVRIQKLPKGAKLVSGIVNLYNTDKKEITENGAIAVYTLGKQSENKDYLGMALVTTSGDLEETGKTPDANGDIRNTYTLRFRTSEDVPVKFRFYAVWEKSHPDLTNANAFEIFLKNELQLFQQPILIQ